MFFLVEKMEWRDRQVSPPKDSLAFFATEAPLFCGDLDPAPTPHGFSLRHPQQFWESKTADDPSYFIYSVDVVSEF